MKFILLKMFLLIGAHHQKGLETIAVAYFYR